MYVGRILRWGSSYGIRISKSDAQAQGIREGQDVLYDIKNATGRVDTSKVHTVKGPGNLSIRHDDVEWP